MNKLREALAPWSPTRLRERAESHLRQTSAGTAILRYAPYALLPLAAIAAGLAPEHLTIRWAFAIIIAASYVILRSSSDLFAMVVLAAMLAYLPEKMDRFEQGILFDVALYAMLGIGLNIVVGYAGLLDLGYVAFFAVGAYAFALLSAPVYGGGFEVGTSFWIVLPMAMVLAALAGVLLGIPVLRLRGDYLAIVTLGFGEIVRIMINNENATGLIGKHVNSTHGITNGPVGVFSIPKPHFFGVDLATPHEMYYVVLVGCLLAAFAAERIRISRVGRAWEAIREDEDVAAAMGVNTTRYKLLAFAIGASIGGIGGVIFAAKQSAVFPSDFNLDVSINVLALVIIGGMGNVRGVVLGSFLLIGLPDVLRDFSINAGFISLDNLGADYRLVIFGAALVAVMVLRPEGLLPSRRRAAEFEQARSIEAERGT
jgi:branched-chain amino acid transport system permease protein